MVVVGPVDGLVEGRLVGIYLEDGTPRIITAFSVDFAAKGIITITKDLLNILVGNPMELQEKPPSVHIALN